MADKDDPEDNTETVFMPSRPPLAAGPEPKAQEPRPETGSTPGRVSVGDVLNGIYEVKRLIARGGMGEVYEGVNINSDERVAIKVMLPTLAADPKVQAMFRKEARTLTRLAHPAVVQYRVLAHEPLLNVLYIVTEFVDGVELTAVLGQIHPTSNEIKSLIRRLGDGLRAAHELGAVHRDISPDNVLLPDRRLDRARIIDFGIAKDLDPSKATIVGDGFAGKLAYVAPEQFGDFGREIGPWTDIYSLGLVIMALATGRDVDMGTTLVEAVDKRRQGIDLSPLPEDLRPILERMLQADPAKRARSMDEVLSMLDEHGRTTFPPTTTSFPPTTSFVQAPTTPPVTTTPPAVTTTPPAASAFPAAPTTPPVTTFPPAQPAAPITSFPSSTTPPTTSFPAEPTTPPVTSFPQTTLPPISPAPVTTPPVTTPPLTTPPGATLQPPPTIPPTTTTPPRPATFAPQATTPPVQPAAPPPLAAALRPAAPAAKKGPPVALMVGGLAAFLIAGVGVAYMVIPKGPPRTFAPTGGQTPATPTTPSAAAPTSAGQAVAAALPILPCSWLDLVGPVQNGQPVKLSGAAGSPATVQDAVMAAARGAGATLPAVGGVDLSAVAQADQGACSALDAFRSFKAPDGAGPSLASAQPAYQITRDADGKLTGEPTITLAPHNPAQDFALLRLDSNGRVSMVYPSRKAFDAARLNDTSITDQGGDAYSVQADALNAAGTAGLLLLTGNGPFDPALLAKPPGARDVTWIGQVRQAASAGGWKSAMVWYKVQNNAPPPKPRVRTGSYYAHPGATEPPPSEPVPTQPAAPPPKKPSAWQRLFGSSSSHGGDSH